MTFCTALAYFITQCGVQAVFWNTKYQERVFIDSKVSEYSKSQQWRDGKSTRKRREHISPSVSHWLKKIESQQWFHPLFMCSLFLKHQDNCNSLLLLYSWGCHLAKKQSSPLVCNTFVVPMSYQQICPLTHFYIHISTYTFLYTYKYKTHLSLNNNLYFFISLFVKGTL